MMRRQPRRLPLLNEDREMKQHLRALRGVLYTAGHMTWGLPQTVVGFGVFLAHARRPHARFHGAVVTTWESHKALSLGPFVFLHGPDAGPDVLARVDRSLLVHEYGHTLQSLILGPAYLAVIGLPSALWLNAPPLVARRERTGSSYYAFFTERWANHLGERTLGEPAPGKPAR